ncbi:hypothetical protein AMTRI_Chr05g65700 [Amborella trichopoda]|uniref:Cop9 signalosome subunit 5 C-terminal domain-containing protein n=1 Tax=Amborella trichopoda TaxID=13333 RepID=W1P842_AMBTC|nr:hypothetical protein AMTR_s00078p00059300 [Amborella trichopoda]
MGSFLVPALQKKEEDSQVAKITRENSEITVKQVHGLMAQVMKDTHFNLVHQASRILPILTDLLRPEPIVETMRN